ncbi:MAG TPA: SH3 domain-containing protein [Thermoanaerobaculia bacterium]|nr:SH3 domain-containing protein [Thermoanaerobaculia bacterium]
MKRIAFLLLFAVACKEQPVIPAMDTREPIGIWYVGAPELNVREQPNDAAPVLATYSNGEAISVLSQKGEWAEVRTGDRAGWARMADLTTAAAKTEAEEHPTPKFRVMPLPISAPSASGEVYIEADVNTDGDVVKTRILHNTTGSEMLAVQNESALKLAKFHPIVVKGERKVFKYYHRVTY